jgi:general stress protein 26
VAKLHDLIEDISVAMLVTVMPEGALRSRPMMTQAMRDEGELWFLTQEDSSIGHDLAQEHAVNVAYADAEHHRYVSVSGQATLTRDREKQQQLWKPGYERFFPRGPDDPDLALLKVRIESAEYWDSSHRKMRPLGEAGTHDSHPGADGASSDLGEHKKVEIRAAPASG